MPDEGAGANSAETQSESGGNASNTAGTSTTDEEQLGEAGKKALDAERKARREAESRAKAAEAKVKEHEDAKLSENERSAKRTAELEAETATLKAALQDTKVEHAVKTAAAVAGAYYPDDVWKLIDPSKVEFNAAGAPKNLDALIEGIRKDRPGYFRGNGSADGGVRGTSAGAEPSMTDLIRAKAGR